MIHPHGLVLRKYVNPVMLKTQVSYVWQDSKRGTSSIGSTIYQQVAFSYGCGQLCHIPSYKNNAVRVPRAKFSRVEDPSR